MPMRLNLFALLAPALLLLPPHVTAADNDRPAGAESGRPTMMASSASSGSGACAGEAEPARGETILPVERTTDLRARRLMGMKVTNTTGETIGDVRDMLVDEDGRLIGVVVSVGGVLGLGGKPVGIAWSDVKRARNTDTLVVAMSKEQVEQAPAFRLKGEQETVPRQPELPMPVPGPTRPETR